MNLAWFGEVAKEEMKKNTIQGQEPLNRKEFEECVTTPSVNSRSREEIHYRVSQLGTKDSEEALEYLRNVSLLCLLYITRLP